jgi:HNH endonuclease
MSDRRYSTARWQRLRRAVLAHYGHVCQVEGPRCTFYATTVHHLIPSSQAPHLFWEPENLVAACRRCNYGDGARVAAENTRQTIEPPTADHRRTASPDRPAAREARRLRSRQAREACRAGDPLAVGGRSRGHCRHAKTATPRLSSSPVRAAIALRTSIAKACRAPGVPLFSPHDLRHRRIGLLHRQGRSWAEIAPGSSASADSR